MATGFVVAFTTLLVFVWARKARGRKPVSFADGQGGGVAVARPPLGIMALAFWPLAANVVIGTLAVASGRPFDALPVDLCAPVIGLAAVGAGVEAVRQGAPRESHGWWSLAGSAIALLLFAGYVGLTG